MDGVGNTTRTAGWLGSGILLIFLGLSLAVGIGHLTEHASTSNRVVLTLGIIFMAAAITVGVLLIRHGLDVEPIG